MTTMRIAARSALASLLVLCSSSGFAADLRGTLPAEPPPPYAPMFSWTGFYIGAHVGYGAMSDDVTTENLRNTASGHLGRDADSVLGGAQVGYNYQVGNSQVVLGLEGDVSGTDLKAKGPVGLTESKTQVFETNKDDVDLLATVRGRLGYAVGRALLYGTGGLALRDGESSRTQYYTSTFNVPFSSQPRSVDKVSDTAVGYTVGGGIEYAFADHWSAKAEYNYLHFEGIRATFPNALEYVQFAGIPAPRRYTVNEDLHLAKLGVNYHF